MYAIDFEYDGQYLSDYGLIICDFNGGSGADIKSAGSEISFNIIPKNKGKKYTLISSQYDTCISASFHICKNPDLFDRDEMIISNDEYRDIARWLNRSEFRKFQVLYDNEEFRDTCYFNAGFNLSRITIGEELVGIELTMETDSPFGYGPVVTKTATIGNGGESFLVSDPSDDIGYIYPDVVLTCNGNGDYTITNSLTGTSTTITDCTSGEVITMLGDPMIISSSVSTHNVPASFNFVYLKVGNTYETRRNTITVSNPCTIKISFSPIIKDFV